MPRLILASSSPRRREILELLDIPFDVVVAPVAESLLPGEAPAEAARRIALLKAQAVAECAVDSGVIVAADTIVVLDGVILGKPANARAAVSMLRALRGRSHQVITGLAVLNLDNGLSAVTSTTSEVHMRQYSDAEIAAYVASGDPLDKAGAYAVQNSAFHPAAKVIGCYLNVVGLPVCSVVVSLRTVGFSLPPIRIEHLIDACSPCCEELIRQAK